MIKAGKSVGDFHRHFPLFLAPLIYNGFYIMKLTEKHILSIFLIIFCLTGLCSCIDEGPCEESVEAVPGKDSPFLRIRFNTVYTRSGEDYSIMPEKVGTLRIIMLNKDAGGTNKIEINELITFNGEFNSSENIFVGTGEKADLFDYTYQTATISGEKKFYIIANEASVGDVTFDVEAGKTISQNILAMKSLTKILNEFTSDIKTGSNKGNSSSTSKGNDLETVLNSISFKPNYQPDTNGDIYLPYTAVYSGIKVGGEYSDDPENKLFDTDMYLVPVATKFNFDFVNYRKQKVKVEDIKISYANNSHFLIPQPDADEITRKHNGEEYYWIDWLAKLTGEYDDTKNTSQFNEQWGWIEKYDVPPSSSKVVWSLNSDNHDWLINPRVNSYTPSTNHFGPFFVPESYNVETKNGADGNSVTNHAYYFSFYMHDIDATEIKAFENNLLPELKALFRATNVIITVTLYDEDVDIYAQISPWTTETFRGYLLEEDD